MRHPSRALAAALGTVMVGGLLQAPAAVAAPSTQQAPEQATEPAAGSRFTLGVLPDTQFYSRYATPETGDLYQQRYGSEPYRTQTEWLVEHDDALNMPFAMHLGDVVDQSDVEGEWVVADDAMSVLEDGGLDHSVLPGNHDIGAQDEQGQTPYQRWFGGDRAAQNSTFAAGHEAPNQESQAHVFEAEGQEYLVLAMAWRGDQATIDWAQQMIDEHPGMPTIVTSHEILDIDGEGSVHLSEAYGQRLFDELISPNDQVFLTLGGHHHGAGVKVLQNEAGNDVVLALQDYQMAYQGGNGLLGVLEFDLTGGRLNMNALSPWVAEKPADTLTQFDDLILDGPSDSWSVPFDFEARFTALDPEWTLGEADDPDYSAMARSIVSEGYVPPVIDQGQLPEDDDDFVAVEDTVAHWRPGQAEVDGVQARDGQVLPSGSVIPDAAGDADMTRAEINTRGAQGSEQDDVTYSSETHPLSSDTGSVCFADSDNGSSTHSWFSTAADAAVNDEDFDEGYTFETFVKIDETWNGDDNPWMGAIARDGRRGDLAADMPEGDEPPSVLAISSLRELQWSSVATEGTTTGTSNWSHEVPEDQWLHVAVVNDPETDTIEMFVDGAPILRDVLDAEGMAATGDPWIMGASMWAGDPANGWLGCIGETRLVEGALTPEQWLTARPADEPAPSRRGDTTTPRDRSYYIDEDKRDRGLWRDRPERAQR